MMKQHLCCYIIILSIVCSGCQKYDTINESHSQANPEIVVQDFFDKTKRNEGQYFDNVFKIVDTNGGIPALIFILDSTNQEDARHAYLILCRLSHSLSEYRELKSTIPNDSKYWNTWWKNTGRKMPPQVMKSNFDSYWK